MIIKQISIFVENKPGRLAEITEIIAKNDINIRALSVADTTHFGILRIIVDDPDRVQRVLKEAGLTVSITSVITAAIKDRPGGLAEVLKLFAAHDIQIEYMYAFIAKSENEAYVVMRIENEEEAVKLLRENGYTGMND
ncbi:MAG: ACT domain-containing protein [Eubacteriales bacterium]|nr:ACT domain-containing protein [Eubacteriales bacterium]MDY4435903.1 ACT domain-containing protein [Candidatus Flemingibacterium sp.]